MGKKWIICITAVVLLFAMAGAGMLFFRRSLPVEEKPLTDKDFLTVRDGAIVNQSGEEVYLQGVNLGGWLIHEYWMCPIYMPGYENNGNALNNLAEMDMLQRRLGKQKTLELMETYQNAWITEWDVQNMAALGCTVLRVPFWYRNFMWNPEGEWINSDFDRNPGFQKLDWIVATAKKYGMYVILDFHGAPGGQSMNQCSGSSAAELFKNPEYQDAMEKLWVAIAKRYRGEPAVAAYDLMNEPEAVKDAVSITEIHDRMYQAIRQVDPEHVITIEAPWKLSYMPVPEKYDWKNVIYQLHYYDDALDKHVEEAVQYRNEHNVPIYFGEFQTAELLKDAGRKCRENGIHFTIWSYKGAGGGVENWFLYDYPRGPSDLLLDTDSYSKLLKKCRQYETKHFKANDAMIEAWNAFQNG